MKSFFPALLVFMTVIFQKIVADFVNPDLRYLDAYTEPDFEGPVQEFLDYAPDLSVYSIDNAIRSVCYSGVWFLYSETIYQGRLVGNFGGLNSCTNLSSSQASSLRYPGSPYGLDDVYYNLYENTYFTGAEFKGNTNAPTAGPLDLNVSSLAITGPSPWTFFTGQEYTGLGVCVYPVVIPSAFGDIDIHYLQVINMEELSLPDNSIRSVAKGCLSERIVREPSSRASLHQDGDHTVINNAH